MQTMENTSGGGSLAQVPAEIDRWNWGAFLLTWIWGLGNDVFIALLMFVPGVNIVMWFVLGARGSAWAWRSRRWESVDAFRRTQRRWAKWGVAGVVLSVVLSVGLVAGIITGMKHSNAYVMAASQLRGNAQVVQILGEPITTGVPDGTIRKHNDEGEAELSFGAKGPRGEGMVHLKASEVMGQWRLDQAVFEDAASRRRVDLLP